MDVEEAKARLVATIQEKMEPFTANRGTVYEVFADSVAENLIGQTFPIHIRMPVDGEEVTVGRFGQGEIVGAKVSDDRTAVEVTIEFEPSNEISIEWTRTLYSGLEHLSAIDKAK